MTVQAGLPCLTVAIDNAAVWTQVNAAIVVADEPFGTIVARLTLIAQRLRFIFTIHTIEDIVAEGSTALADIVRVLVITEDLSIQAFELDFVRVDAAATTMGVEAHEAVHATQVSESRTFIGILADVDHQGVRWVGAPFHRAKLRTDTVRVVSFDFADGQAAVIGLALIVCLAPRCDDLKGARIDRLVAIGRAIS